jgi:hypothetical protein
MGTPRIFLAMQSGGTLLPENLRPEFQRIAQPARLWALAVLLSSWISQRAKAGGYDFSGDWVYVSSLAGRFASLRPFVESAARAQDAAELERAAAAFAYFVQVAGLPTLDGILRLSALDRALVAVPPPIDTEALRAAAGLTGSGERSAISRIRQFDAPRFGEHGETDV